MREALETPRMTGHIGGNQRHADTGNTMGAKGAEKRQSIINAANALFYHKGFAQTSFADIATEADVPKGNFYFYFRTKEDLLQAVVEDRLARMVQMMEGWRGEFNDPRKRLHRIADIPAVDKDDVTRFGCPMGTLSAELGKSDTIDQNFITAMFDQILSEAEASLIEMGCAEQDANQLARHLIVRLQGAANMAHTYGDERWIEDEIQAVHDWIDGL